MDLGLEAQRLDDQGEAAREKCRPLARARRGGLASQSLVALAQRPRRPPGNERCDALANAEIDKIQKGHSRDQLRAALREFTAATPRPSPPRNCSEISLCVEGASALRVSAVGRHALRDFQTLPRALARRRAFSRQRLRANIARAADRAGSRKGGALEMAGGALARAGLGPRPARHGRAAAPAYSRATGRDSRERRSPPDDLHRQTRRRARAHREALPHRSAAAQAGQRTHERHDPRRAGTRAPSAAASIHAGSARAGSESSDQG